MRILHTGDWHVGKKLGRIDRSAESEAVLDEVVAIARDQEVDAVLVCGDLFDRALPAFLSLGSVLEALVRLADGATHVVAIAGNHDSAELFEVLAPHLAGSGVTLVPKCREPDRGGVVTVPSRDGKTTAQIACVPFIHEAQVIELMGLPEEGYKRYADRVRAITRHYAGAMTRRGGRDSVDLLVGHFMVHGAVPSGTERELHIGDAYMATADAIPPEVHYAALGHIHRAQEAPGSAVPARYCGSLLQLDFGEAGQDKSVCVVELEPERPARVECIPITSGRKLLKVQGSLDELEGRAPELGDAILSVEVPTSGPVPGLADDVRKILPNALYVRPIYERSAEDPSPRAGLSIEELYAEFVRKDHGVDPAPDLMEAFRELAGDARVKVATP